MEGEQEISTSVGQGGSASYEVPQPGQAIETQKYVSDVSSNRIKNLMRILLQLRHCLYSIQHIAYSTNRKET